MGKPTTKEVVNEIEWETFGHVGNSESGEAFNRTVEANVTTRWAVKSDDSTLTYVGTAIPGSLTSASVWQISRVDDTGNELWADGDTLFNNIFEDRESLSYS
jgi:hypothetical protein